MIENTWSLLREPLEKNCFNCKKHTSNRHNLNLSGCPLWYPMYTEKDKLCTLDMKNKSWSKWEWNGKK